MSVIKVVTALVTLSLLAGCAEYQLRHRQQLADKAREQAVREGNSGPLYNHYVSCLDTFWRHALDEGSEENIYESGLADCAYELQLLCNYYAVSSCYQDAKLANRLLFSLMLEDYYQHRQQATHR